MTPIETAQEVTRLLANLEPIVIYGFGSFFSGHARDDSDIDVAFWSRRDATSLELYAIAQEGGAVLGRDVHLVALKTADAIIRVQVVTTGKVLSCPDPHARAELEMYALSDYARLNEERHEVLERIRKEGTVFDG